MLIHSVASPFCEAFSNTSASVLLAYCLILPSHSPQDLPLSQITVEKCDPLNPSERLTITPPVSVQAVKVEILSTELSTPAVDPVENDLAR